MTAVREARLMHHDVFHRDTGFPFFDRFQPRICAFETCEPDFQGLIHKLFSNEIDNLIIQTEFPPVEQILYGISCCVHFCVGSQIIQGVIRDRHSIFHRGSVRLIGIYTSPGVLINQLPILYNGKLGTGKTIFYISFDDIADHFERSFIDPGLSKRPVGYSGIGNTNVYSLFKVFWNYVRYLNRICAADRSF